MYAITISHIWKGHLHSTDIYVADNSVDAYAAANKAAIGVAEQCAGFYKERFENPNEYNELATDFLNTGYLDYNNSKIYIKEGMLRAVSGVKNASVIEFQKIELRDNKAKNLQCMSLKKALITFKPNKKTQLNEYSVIEYYFKNSVEVFYRVEGSDHVAVINGGRVWSSEFINQYNFEDVRYD